MTPALAILILLTYCLHMSQPAISGLQNAIYSRFLTHQTFSYGERAFQVATPTLWNYLPIHIRQSPTIHIFKIYLLFRIMLVVRVYYILVLKTC